MSAGRARKRSVSSSRIRRISSRSRSSSSTMSLLISTVAAGSRKSVAPVVDEPCTMPGTLPRCSARTISTNRPLRSVMTSSCRYFDDEPRVYCSSVPRSFCRFWRSSLRIRFSSGLALSSTSPPGSIASRTAATSSLNAVTFDDQLAQDRGSRRRRGRCRRAPDRPSRRSRRPCAAAAARAGGPARRARRARRAAFRRRAKERADGARGT